MLEIGAQSSLLTSAWLRVEEDGENREFRIENREDREREREREREQSREEQSRAESGADRKQEHDTYFGLTQCVGVTKVHLKKRKRQKVRSSETRKQSAHTQETRNPKKDLDNAPHHTPQHAEPTNTTDHTKHKAAYYTPQSAHRTPHCHTANTAQHNTATGSVCHVHPLTMSKHPSTLRRETSYARACVRVRCVLCVAL